MHLTTTTTTVRIEWPLLVLLVLVVSSASAVTGHKHRLCPFNASEPAPDGARLVNDTLWAGQPERPYPPSAYRPVPGGGYVLCTCTDPAKPCLRKCCKPNLAFNNKNLCREINKPHDNFTVPIFVNATVTIGAYDADKFKLIYGKPICDKNCSRYLMNPLNKSSDNFRISESGMLLKESGSDIIAEPDQFCLEQFGEFNYTILPVVCSKPENNPHNINIMYTIGMILSLPFLFSTFLVYALIEDLQNLHGKSLMCHVATLLMAYTSLAAVQLITDKIGTDFCIILAFIIQFSFLASFFWLNVMCFDLWWTFSGLRPIRGNLKEHEAKKFIIYSIYAWGCTSSISLVTMYMQQVPSTMSTMSFIDPPEFGKKSCWFGSKSAILLYFYAPIGILLFSNLLMFIYTAVMIVKHMRNANVFKGSESNRNVDHEKQRFMLYLKLFIVMGVNWIAEIISWATDPDGSKSNIWWYLTDIGNSLQGVLIFLIFVCKKRVLRLLNKRLCPRFELFKTSTISTRTTNSFTSRSSTKNKDVEMTPKNVQNSTVNQLHDFKV